MVVGVIVLVLIRALVSTVVELKAVSALMAQLRIVGARSRALNSSATAAAMEVKAKTLASAIHVPLVLIADGSLPGRCCLG